MRYIDNVQFEAEIVLHFLFELFCSGDICLPMLELFVYFWTQTLIAVYRIVYKQ